MKKEKVDYTQKTAFQIAALRSGAFKEIRDFFHGGGFLEIDAPILVSANAVEAYIDPIKTRTHDPKTESATDLYLHTSPEIYMKRLLSRGFKRIYFLGHVFRDREASPIHLNEFSMLEWYEVDVELDQMITRSEQLFCGLARWFNQNNYLNNKKISFTSGFDRLSMAQAWEKFAKIDLLECLQLIADGRPNALANAVRDQGEFLRADATFEDAFTHIMLKKVEPRIGKNRPCVIYDWPAQSSALALLNPENPLLAKRFEIYCGGMELANAFAELTDTQEQRDRFKKDNQIRADRNQEMLPINEEFLSDLAQMPSSCGIAVGIDRIFALLCGAKSIKEVFCLLP